MSWHPLVPWWAVLLGVLVLGPLAVLSVRDDRPIGRGPTRAGWVRLALVAVLGLVLLHPGVGAGPSRSGSSNLEVLVVLDTTTSMAAEDWAGGPTRLDGVRQNLARLAQDLGGSRFALITFGRVARLEMPFSSDTTAFLAAVSSVHREDPFDGTGSGMDRPLDTMREVLTRARDQHPERRRVVVFLSDGEVTEQSGPQQSYAELAPLVDGGAVVGYGTTAGGRMQVFEGARGAGSYVFDQSTGAEARSKIDEPNLRRIAGELGIGYVHSTDARSLDTVASGIDIDHAAGDRDVPATHDLTWVLALVLAVLALVELRRVSAAAAAAREEVASW